MRIVLWILRLAALLVAVTATAWVVSELPGGLGLLAYLAGPVPLLAYAWGLVIGLLWMRPDPAPPRCAWLAVAPLTCQLGAYLVFWSMRSIGQASYVGTTTFEVVGILAFLALLFGFPAALPAGLVFTRARPLLVIEALGPPVIFLLAGTGALFG